MFKLQYILSVAVLITLGSCVNYRNISIGNVSNPQLSAIGGGKFQVRVDAQINNPTRRKVALKSATLQVYRQNALFATLTLPQPVVVPKRSNGVHPIDAELQLHNMLLALLGLGQLSVNDFSVEGSLTASAFPLCKTVKIERQSLQVFSEQYGDIFSPLLKMQKSR